MDSGKHFWSGVLVQYSEHEQENCKKLHISYPITYQSGTFQGSQKNWGKLTKEAENYIHIISENGLLFQRHAHYDAA